MWSCIAKSYKTKGNVAVQWWKDVIIGVIERELSSEKAYFLTEGDNLVAPDFLQNMSLKLSSK